MLTEHCCQIAGSSRNYADSGTGDAPILFLHGVTRRWQCFQPILPTFAQSHRIYALDFRGHGKSEPATSGYRVIDYASDAVEFIKTVIGQPTIVYGHSLGSMVAAAVAKEIPELVTAVILEDPPFATMGSRIALTPLLGYFSAMTRWAGSDHPVKEIASELAEIRLQVPGQTDAIRLGDMRDASWFRFAARCLQQLDPAVITPIANEQWLDGYDWEEILAQIRTPALLLQATLERGGMLTDEDALRAKELIPDCCCVKFDCHHLIHWYNTQRLINTTLEFLGSI